MSYKTGETPQKNDEILGEIDGKAARGRVLAVRENGDVLVTRRAPYQGTTKPLAYVHEEVPAAGLSLVYRPINHGAAPATRAAVAAGKAAKAEPKAAKAAPAGARAK